MQNWLPCRHVALSRWVACGGVLLLVVSLAVSHCAVLTMALALPLLAVYWYLGCLDRYDYWLAALPWTILLIPHAVHSHFYVNRGVYASDAILILSFAILTFRANPRYKKAGWAGWAVGAMTGWMEVGALVGGYTGHDWAVCLYAMRLALLAWISFEAARLGGSSAGRRFGASVLALVGLLGAVACAEAVVRAPLFVGGWFGDSEVLAIHLVMLLPVGLGFILAFPAGFSMRSMVGWLAWVLGAAALAMTFSRSGWAGGYVGLGVVAALSWWYHRRPAAGWVLVLLGLGGLGVVLVLAGLPILPESFAPLRGRLGSLVSGHLLDTRLGVWKLGENVLREHPLVGNPDAPNCYNLYLGLASRSGWPTLLFYVVLVAGTIRSLWRAMPVSGMGLFAAGLTGALAGHLVTGIGESSLSVQVTPEVMSIIGLAAGLGMVRAKE